MANFVDTSEILAQSWFTIIEHAKANVYLYLCFQLRIMYVKNKLLISFYAVRILSTKFEGYRHALYQQIIVYTADLITRMHYAVFRMTLNVEFIPFWYEQKSHMWSLALIHSQSFENARRSL